MEKTDKIVEKKQEKVIKPVVKGKKKKPILVITLIILLIISLSSAGYFIYKASELQKSLDESKEVVQEEEEEVVEEEEETIIEETEEEIVEEEAVQYPSYKLTLTNSGFIQIPEGWRVSKIESNSTQLTSTQMTDYLNPINHGFWPMYEGSILELTKGDSVIEFNRPVQFVPGGIGFTALLLDSSYEIILEPTVDDSVSNPDRSKFGIARKLISGKYEYVHIVKDSGGLGDGTGYVDVNVGPSYYEFRFSGSLSDRNTAEVLFKNACMIDTSKLCGSL